MTKIERAIIKAAEWALKEEAHWLETHSTGWPSTNKARAKRIRSVLADIKAKRGRWGSEARALGDRRG